MGAVGAGSAGEAPVAAAATCNTRARRSSLGGRGNEEPSLQALQTSSESPSTAQWPSDEDPNGVGGSLPPPPFRPQHALWPAKLYSANTTRRHPARSRVSSHTCTCEITLPHLPISMAMVRCRSSNSGAQGPMQRLFTSPAAMPGGVIAKHSNRFP